MHGATIKIDIYHLLPKSALC